MHALIAGTGACHEGLTELEIINSSVDFSTQQLERSKFPCIMKTPKPADKHLKSTFNHQCPADSIGSFVGIAIILLPK